MMKWINGGRVVTASRWLAAWSLIVYGSLVGCGKPGYSGFLRDYSELKPDPAAEGAMAYTNPAKPLKQYDKFIIDRVFVHFAPTGKGASINPADLKKLTDYFRRQVVSGLSATGRYQVVNDPGPDVLRISIAVTSIRRTKVVPTRSQKHRVTSVRLGGATMEAEGFDSESGERVIAVVDSRSGGRVQVSEGMTQFDHVRQVIRHWVRRFVNRLDEAHGHKVN